MQWNFNRHHRLFRSNLVPPKRKGPKTNLQELQAIAWICRLLASLMGLSYSLNRTVVWRWRSQVNRSCLSSILVTKKASRSSTSKHQVWGSRPVRIKIWHISSWMPHKRAAMIKVLNRFSITRLPKEESNQALSNHHLVILMRSKTLECSSRTPLWLLWIASFQNLTASMDLQLTACSAISC